VARKIFSYVVLAMVLGIAAYLFIYQKHQERARLEAQRKASERVRAQIFRDIASRKKLPDPDADMQYLPKSYPRPQSAWRSAEKAFYKAVLAKGRFDILVVPWQVQKHAFARDLRSFMAAELAAAIGDATQARIPDPYLVARALGEGERTYDLGEIFDLANALGARRIVAAYVGHDEHRIMRITLHSYQRRDNERFGAAFAPHRGTFGPPLPVPSERLEAKHFEGLAYSDEKTPIEAYESQLPAMLAFLGLKADALGAAKPLSRFESPALPASPLALAGEAPNPARDAYLLQLMAQLVPASADRARERLVEKSLLAVRRMSPESPDYRVLEARALMGLGLRPAALRALGTPASAEEKHLHAVLNGNLPAVQALRPQRGKGVRGLLATLEENALAVAYGVREAQESLGAIAGLKLAGELWPYLARRAATDADVWTQHENLELKALLDAELPVPGYTAQAMLRGTAATGDVMKLQALSNLSVLEHTRRYIDAAAAQWCCRPLSATPGPADFLDLASAIGTDNLMRRANLLAVVQAVPSSALAFLASIESSYKDHPQFELMRGKAELALGRSAGGESRNNHLRSAYRAGFNVWYWEQGQTHAAAEAFQEVVNQTGRLDYWPYDNFYADDYPYRPFYSFWQHGGDPRASEANARAALANSPFDFTPVRQLKYLLGDIRRRWEEFDALLGSLGERFEGLPERIELVAQASQRKGEIQLAEKYYREGIRLQPNGENLYSELGALLFENAEDDKAARAFMSFPGLKRQSANAVGLSNYAFGAGSPFYWRGDFAHALPLFRIAAGLNTGSNASIESAVRLAMVKGDYLSALRGTLERGNRYGSAYGYRDYLGLLHALGHSREAWEGFAALVQQIEEPPLWETALVGHRRENASEADIAAWAAREPMRSAGRDNAYAAVHLLRAAVTDRKPSPELPARIAAIERPVWQLQYRYRHVVRPSTDSSRQVVLGPDSPEPATLPLGVFAATPKVRVKSDLVYYAEAYAAIRAGKFRDAKAALEEAATLYDLRKVSLGYLLPPYAYAAARAGDTAALLKLLEGFSQRYQRFDYYLARAALAALSGRHDEAGKDLELALHRRPFTEFRAVFTEYQYAELCEWLFEATGNSRYRAAAVDWAKKNQVSQPWASWAYAIEARLGAPGPDRARAIAMTQYLDPGSERLKRVPKKEVQAAIKGFAARNPFVAPSLGARKEPI
jgi:hypothetical protein